MPSNFTENYELSQWEKSDQVLMEDFNDDNAKIDAAIKAVDTKANGKADQSALNDLKQTVNTLSGTVSGHTSALSDHDGSLARLGNCQVYTTTYVGTGDKSRSLTFPGYPVYVYLRGFTRTEECFFWRGLNVDSAYTYSAQWSDRGLSLRTPDSSNFGINIKGVEFYVFALLDMSK